MIADFDTFELGGHTYRVGRLDTFAQMDLATSMRQVFFQLALLESEAADEVKAARAAKQPPPRPLTDADYARAFCGLLGTMPREEQRTAISTCLGVVARGRGKNNAHWDQAVMGGQFMMNDLDLPELMALAYRVVYHNGLIRFFFAGPATPEVRTGAPVSSGSEAA